MLGTRLEKVITRAVIGISSIHCTGLVYISKEKGSLLDHRRNQKEKERVTRIRERKEKKRSRACVHCISLLIHLSLYNLLEWFSEIVLLVPSSTQTYGFTLNPELGKQSVCVLFFWFFMFLVANESVRIVRLNTLWVDRIKLDCELKNQIRKWSSIH